MDFYKIILLSVRNLFRNKRRTLITLIIIGSGYLALSLVAGYVQNAFLGLKKMTIMSTFTGSGGTGHFQVVRKDFIEKQEKYPLEFGIDNYQQKIKCLNHIEHVLYTTPRIEFSGLISSGEKSMSFLGLGVNPENEARLRSGLTLVKIDNTPLLELKKELYGVILGRKMAEILQVKIGDWLQILTTTVDGSVNAIDVKVVGSFSTGSKIADKYFLMTNIPAVSNVMRTNKINRFVVILDDSKYTEIVAKEAKTILEAKEPSINYLTPKWYELGEYYNAIKKMYIIIFSFMSIVIFIIVMLSCNNTLLMAMMERIQEIGTLRAIGISLKWIKSIFITEGIILGVISSFLGFVIQQVLVVIINNLHIAMPPPPGTDIEYRLLIEPFPILLPVIFLFIILSTTIASIITFRKVQNMSIVDALNHN